MHKVLTVPLIIEGIFGYLFSDTLGLQAERGDSTSLKAKFKLADVCRLWREVLGHRIFDQLCFRIGHRRTQESNSSGSMAKTIVGGDRYVYRTNMDMALPSVPLRRLVLHIGKGDVVTEEMVEFLTQSVFAGHNWPSVQAVSIAIGTDFGLDTINSTRFRQLERVVRAIIKCAPNTIDFAIISANIAGPPIDLMAALGSSVEGIASLKLQYCDTTDYSRLALPALTALSITTMHANNVRSVPVFNPEVVRCLEFAAVYSDSLLHAFVRGASGQTVTFPQLEKLYITFTSDISGLDPEGRWGEYQFEFPKLRNLYIDPKNTPHCAVSEVFAHAPLLETLSVYGNQQAMVGWDLSRYPMLHTVKICSDSLSRPLSMADMHRYLLGPTSSIRMLSVATTSPLDFESVQFGCMFLCTLELDFIVSRAVFEHVLPQLLYLKRMKVYYKITAWDSSADDSSNSRMLEAVRNALSACPDEPLSTSLQQLTVCDAYHLYGRSTTTNASYGPGAAEVIGIAARIPSLMRIKFVWSTASDRMPLADIFSDERVQRAARHFADIAAFD